MVGPIINQVGLDEELYGRARLVQTKKQRERERERETVGGKQLRDNLEVLEV